METEKTILLLICITFPVICAILIPILSDYLSYKKEQRRIDLAIKEAELRIKELEAQQKAKL